MPNHTETLASALIICLKLQTCKLCTVFKNVFNLPGNLFSLVRFFYGLYKAVCDSLTQRMTNFNARAGCSESWSSLLPNSSTGGDTTPLWATCPNVWQFPWWKKLFYFRTDHSKHTSRASLHRGQIVKPPVTTDFSGSLASMQLYKIV